MATDQRLAELFERAGHSAAFDGVALLVEELDWEPEFADTAIWWPSTTLHDVIRRLTETTVPEWREHCREMRRKYDVEPDPVRRALLSEAWRRRCAAGIYASDSDSAPALEVDRKT